MSGQQVGGRCGFNTHARITGRGRDHLTCLCSLLLIRQGPANPSPRGPRSAPGNFSSRPEATWICWELPSRAPTFLKNKLRTIKSTREGKQVYPTLSSRSKLHVNYMQILFIWFIYFYFSSYPCSLPTPVPLQARWTHVPDVQEPVPFFFHVSE